MGLLALKDIVRCPSCGSRDVIYTCEPKCCFNHLCAECRTTFELATRKSGELSVLLTGAAEPLSGEPSVACAKCESLRIVVVDADNGRQLACAECGAALELNYENICAEG